MSRFYASIHGSRGPATRQGTPRSGIYGHVRGWNVGVEVDGSAHGDADVFDVYATHGSNGRGLRQAIARVRLNPDGSLDIERKDGPCV